MAVALFCENSVRPHSFFMGVNNNAQKIYAVLVERTRNLLDLLDRPDDYT